MAGDSYCSIDNESDIPVHGTEDKPCNQLQRNYRYKKIQYFFRRVIKVIIPRAPSAVSGNIGVFNDGVTFRRVAETWLIEPAVTRMLVE